MNHLSRARNHLQPLWADGRGWILSFVALGWLLTNGTRFAIPALFPHLRSAMGLDFSTLGVLYTLLWATYALGQFPAGYVGDHIGVRRTLSYGTVLSAVALLFVGVITGVELLFVGMVLFGATSALYGPARFAVLTNVYDEYAGTAIGLTQAAGQIGNTLLPALTGVLATVLFWQAGVLYIVPLFVIAGIGIWLVVPDPTDPDGGAAAADGTTPFRDIVAGTFSPRALVLTGMLSLTVFIIQGLTGFYPTYLVEVKGFTPTTASTVFALLFASAMIIQPLAGSLNDAIGTTRSLLLTGGAIVLSLPLAPLASTLTQVVVVTVVLGSVFGIAPIALTRLTNTLAPEIRQSGLGLLRTGYFLIGSTGSLVIGTLADRGLFDETFYVLTVLGAVVLLLAFVFGRLSDRPNP